MWDGFSTRPQPLADALWAADRLRTRPTCEVDSHHRLDPATHIEVALHGQPARRQRGDQIVGDAIGHRLVERPFVTKRPEVELERLQLDALLIGDVTNAD